MKHTHTAFGWLAVLGTATLIQCISQRKIYTLFTVKSTWNEAKEVCQTQFGQLLKIDSDRVLKEVQYLDQNEWSGVILADQTTGGRLWTGVHKPFNNDTIMYQDCEETTGLTIDYEIPSGECGNYMHYPITSQYNLRMSSCDQPALFVCERYEGDCWFEPYMEAQGKAIPGFAEPFLGEHEAEDCALECRNKVSSLDGSSECWAFFYIPSANQCFLYFVSTSNAASDSTTVSAFYLSTNNHDPLNTGMDPDSVLYVRRCFEGSLDSNVYNLGAQGSSPSSICTTASYPGPNNVTDDVCFCSTEEHPPIPKPISSEKKAEEYIRQLSIDTSNTSSSQRRLISAEDNRASAIGVGFVGVLILTVVFGGVFLMDVTVFYAAIKKTIAAFKSS